jgi:hypothetical protein
MSLTSENSNLEKRRLLITLRAWQGLAEALTGADAADVTTLMREPATHNQWYLRVLSLIFLLPAYGNIGSS